MFGKKKKKTEEVKSEEIVTKERSLVDPSYNIKKLYKKRRQFNGR